jgi:hypothetical protein
MTQEFVDTDQPQGGPSRCVTMALVNKQDGIPELTARRDRSPAVPQVPAQSGGGVLGPVQAPGLQDRHHVVGELLE